MVPVVGKERRKKKRSVKAFQRYAWPFSRASNLDCLRVCLSCCGISTKQTYYDRALFTKR